jgi:hypothetical protein
MSVLGARIAGKRATSQRMVNPFDPQELRAGNRLRDLAFRVAGSDQKEVRRLINGGQEIRR